MGILGEKNSQTVDAVSVLTGFYHFFFFKFLRIIGLFNLGSKFYIKF